MSCSLLRLLTVTVHGVAQLGDYLYIIAFDSPPKVGIYDISDRQLAATIELPDIDHPIDIVACQKSQRVYVADFTCIWWVPPDGNYEVWLQAEFPTPVLSSVSVTNGRLLVTSYMYQQLLLYNEEKERIARVNLPTYMMPLHAAESPSLGTIILSHAGTFTDLTKCEEDFFQICEVGINGEILRTFGDPDYTSHVGLQTPQYIALDSGGRLFVADSGKRRVLLINSDFQLECVVAENLESDPHRLCYDEQSGLLTVSDLTGCVSVFNIS